MKNLMEKQLSWLALLITAFYSLLASCCGEDCNSEELARCARPLQKINGSSLGFVTRKEDLVQHCPDLENGMECIKKYNLRCMKKKQRERFNQFYSGTNKVIRELCQDGPYQDEFLRHAPCMQKVQLEYEQCYNLYQKTMQEIQSNRTTDSPVKAICCSFKEYVECSHHKVRSSCGDETAQFTKEFLDRMSTSLIQMHCEPYTREVCLAHAGSDTVLRIGTMLPLAMMLIARYFT